MSPPEHLAPDALAREAAAWFARMRGPDAAARQSAFDAWLARGPENRAAYNRASEVFALGKLLADDPPVAPPRRRVRWRAPLAAALSCALAAGIWWGGDRQAGPRSNAVAAAAQARPLLVTEPGEERLARLSDGSTARLAGDSKLAIAFGRTQRLLLLERGSARFDVRHETRPFIVMAGGGSVTARGTMFDVDLTRTGQVEVRLIRGVIDVQLPHPRANRIAPVRRLVAGESIAFVVPRNVSPPAPQLPATQASAGPIDANADARSFASVPVAMLVAEANRSTTRPIRLADGKIGAERVSGRVRIDDTEVLARRLSSLFGWSADTSNPKEIVLRP
jgi:transmembrane sensor